MTSRHFHRLIWKQKKSKGTASPRSLPSFADLLPSFADDGVSVREKRQTFRGLDDETKKRIELESLEIGWRLRFG